MLRARPIWTMGTNAIFDLDTVSALAHDAGFTIAYTKGLLLKPFATGQLNTLNLSPAVWRALFKVSTSHPRIFNAIYLEATA